MGARAMTSLDPLNPALVIPEARADSVVMCVP